MTGEENPTIGVMTSDASTAPPGASPVKTPRAWPAIILIAALWVGMGLARWIDLTMFERFMASMILLAVITLLFLVWWLVSRRTTWIERATAVVAAIVVNVIAIRFTDPSLHGPAWLFLLLPIMLTGWALYWAVARRARPIVRTGGVVAVIVLACSAFTLLRSEGVSGEQDLDLRWRWSKTPEQRFLAAIPIPSVAAARLPGAAVVASDDDWPGFRGPRRDGIVRGLSIGTDWAAHPPKLIWRQPVGPGWCSAAVAGNRVFTHEQRGASEIVTCRDADTGSIVWMHDDPGRFEESMAGAGPRATPYFLDGKLYTFGALGTLNCLDAAGGSVIWSRNVVADTGVALPMWGFASSPLIMRDIVMVYVGGNKGLLGYHTKDGQPAWSIPTGVQCYTSPQPATLDGVEQVLFLSDMALVAADPVTGRLLWNHDVPSPQAPRAIQPNVISPTQVLISSETDLGTALVNIQHSNDTWTAQRKWTSRVLKPSFDDYVVQDGCIYGFDGAVFCCTDVQTGKRVWRDGRYGHGQVVLLADQKLLLLTSEEGELILLRATRERNVELGKIPAISGKTWNHPAIARGRVFVRNGQEMAAFVLPLAETKK